MRRMSASRGHGQYSAPPQLCTSIGTQPRMIGPGDPTGFFQSSVSALRASRTLLCTTTGAFDLGRGCSIPPGLVPSAIQTNNHQRRVANLGDLFFFPDSGRCFAQPLGYLILPLWGGGVRWLIGRPQGSFAKTGRGMITHVRDLVVFFHNGLQGDSPGLTPRVRFTEHGYRP
jgi:hypothetical protein